ncbi:hypothetical protein [Microbacterium imperiale]|uniref:hypothetical protein n=1 Tax=Microbacterium imperiale TaxID=33884 RepID=UPI001AE34FC1|nr:hypothetical protein [Microbacterium imperiale]MBP2420730.1 hypothetical protein [Microbacterium imperiale]MDS0200633.1 hypothetical protein [Microbacterium imperiale]BFE41071.1 hypothetical protein GCM10017544_20270 [Microbacterium imperiale]
MSLIVTADVFTPAKLPTVTDVDRTGVSAELSRWVNRGGFFVSLLGTTKLGKTTLVKTFLAGLPADSWSVYLPGQSLGSGADDLWLKLAQQLQIPTSKESGLASSDKTSWGFLTRLQLSWLGAGAAVQSNATNEQQDSSSSVQKFNVDPSVAVTEAVGLLRANSRKVVIAIDDFHFVTDAAARRAIVLALRPLADLGCAVILSTIPGGELDPAFSTTNTGGRRKTVTVPRWGVEELEQIATQGLKALRLWASPDLITNLAEQSFGSPQIMQQLCLDLCEMENNIFHRDELEDVEEVCAPDDMDKFFRSLEDDEALGWLAKLSAGPDPRRKRGKKTYPIDPPTELDGYQLIMQSLHDFGSPHELPLAELKKHVGDRLQMEGKELGRLALELKARNLGLLASKDTTSALEAQNRTVSEDTPDDESDEEEFAFAELVAAEAIPQPVFELQGTGIQASIRILDPLLSYMIKWHPEKIVESGRG